MKNTDEFHKDLATGRNEKRNCGVLVDAGFRFSGLWGRSARELHARWILPWGQLLAWSFVHIFCCVYGGCVFKFKKWEWVCVNTFNPIALIIYMLYTTDNLVYFLSDFTLYISHAYRFRAYMHLEGCVGCVCVCIFYKGIINRHLHSGCCCC